MKKILLLAAFAACFAFTGCSNNEGGGGTDGNLVGKWELITDYTFEDGEWVVDYEYEAGEYAIEFKSDGTASTYDEGVEFPWGTYTYDKSSKVVTLVFEGETQRITVKTLTKSRLDADDGEYRVVARRL